MQGVGIWQTKITHFFIYINWRRLYPQYFPKEKLKTKWKKKKRESIIYEEGGWGQLRERKKDIKNYNIYSNASKLLCLHIHTSHHLTVKGFMHRKRLLKFLEFVSDFRTFMSLVILCWTRKMFDAHSKCYPIFGKKQNINMIDKIYDKIERKK